MAKSIVFPYTANLSLKVAKVWYLTPLSLYPWVVTVSSHRCMSRFRWAPNDAINISNMKHVPNYRQSRSWQSGILALEFHFPKWNNDTFCSTGSSRASWVGSPSIFRQGPAKSNNRPGSGLDPTLSWRPSQRVTRPFPSPKSSAASFEINQVPGTGRTAMTLHQSVLVIYPIPSGDTSNPLPH